MKPPVLLHTMISLSEFVAHRQFHRQTTSVFRDLQQDWFEEGIEIYPIFGERSYCLKIFLDNVIRRAACISKGIL